jgi:hypothetical protein
MISITSEAEQVLANTDWTVMGATISEIEKEHDPNQTTGSDIKDIVSKIQEDAKAKGVTFSDE